MNPTFTDFPTTHGVVWQDLGCCMSILRSTPELAIAEAQGMHARATEAGITLHYLRAVTCHKGLTIETLWEQKE